MEVLSGQEITLADANQVEIKFINLPEREDYLAYCRVTNLVGSGVKVSGGEDIIDAHYDWQPGYAFPLSFNNKDRKIKIKGPGGNKIVFNVI